MNRTGAMDPSFAQKRKAEEIERIKTSQRVFVYRKNNKVGDETRF